MFDIMSDEYRPGSEEIRITTEYRSPVRSFVNSVYHHDALNDLLVDSRRGLIASEVESTQYEGVLLDVLRMVEICPVVGEREAHACATATLWLANKEGLLKDVRPGDKNWMRLVMPQRSDASQKPRLFLDHCPGPMPPTSPPKPACDTHLTLVKG